MADAMDTRIVEMQFDNKDFEKNISVSQKSLEKFKKELNFDETSRGLDNFSKSVKQVDFSTMENNIQKLTDKFTGLGHVGEFVLSRIRKTLEGVGDKIISFTNSLTTAQTKAGFVKYESLNKSVQTLRSATGKEEKEIYSVLGRLTKYTDETSYDFAQGVTSISQLVSSGAATLDQAEKTVEGFYNYAAKAGADTQKAAQALNYSFVQAMQKGYLDWSNAKELSNRSLLTMDFKQQLLEEAVAVGTLTKENGKYYAISKKGKKQKKIEVNATNLFNDSLQHQWATTKVLNNVMGKYQDTTQEFGAQAYAAAQRCTTFTDALNAWKDMVSTGWMTSYRTIFGDLSEAMSLFSAVCNKVSDALSGIIEARNKVLNAWKEMGGRDSLMGMLFGELEDPDGNILFKGAHGILDILTGVGDMLSEGWWNMVKNLVPEGDKDRIVKEVNDNMDAINQALIRQGLGDMVITKPFESFDELWNADFFKATGGREGAFGGGLQQVTKNIQNFVERVHEWFNTVDEGSGTTRLEKIQKILNAIINTISFGFQIVGGIIDFFGMIFNQLQPSITAVTDFFATLFGGIEEGEQAIRKSNGIKKFFTGLAEILRPVTNAINKVVTSVMGLITAIFQSGEAASTVSGVWGTIKNVLSKLWGLIKAVGGPIVTLITSVIDSLADLFRNGFTKENIAAFRANVSAAFRTMIDSIWQGIKPVYDKIASFLAGLWKTVSTAIAGYFNDENTVGYKVIKWIRGAVETIKQGLNKLFPGAADSVKGFFANLFNTIKKAVSNGGIFKGLKDFGKKFVSTFTSYFKEGFLDGFRKIGKAISDVFKGLFIGEKIASETQKSMGFLERIKNAFVGPGTLGEGLLNLFRTIRNWWNSLGSDVKALIAVGVVVGILIKKAVKCVKSISEGFSDFASVFKDGFGKIKSDGFAKKFLIISVSMAIMTAAISKLASLELGKGIQGLAFAALLLVGIRVFLKSMAKVLKEMTIKDSLKLTIGVIGIAMAIKKIVNALLPVANLELDQLKNMGLALAGIGLVMAGLMYISKESKFSWGSGGGMLLFAISIGVFIRQLEKLLVYKNRTDDIDFMLGALVVIVAAFAVLGAAMKKAANGFFGAAALAVAISILIFSLKSIMNLKPMQLLKMGAVLAVSLAMMWAFVAAMGKLKNNKGLKDSAMVQLIGLAAGIALLILALKQVANIGGSGNWEPLAKMGATLGGVILGLVVLIAAVNKLEGEKNRGLKKSGLTAIIGLALGIAALILVLQMVADMKWNQIGKMGATFGVIMIGLIGLIVAIGKTANDNQRGLKGSGLFWGMAAIIAGIAGLIAVLSQTANMSKESVAKMLITYAVIIAGLAVLIKSLTSFTKVNGGKLKDNLGIVAVMAAVVGGIIGLILVMQPLAKMQWSGLAKIWITMAVMVSSFKKFFGAVPKEAKFKDSLNIILQMAAFVGSIWALIEVLKPLGNMSWNALIKTVVGLKVLSSTLINSVKEMMEAGSGENAPDFKGMINTLLEMAGFVVAIWGLTEVLKPLGDMSWNSLLKTVLGFAAFAKILIKSTTSLTEASGGEEEGPGFKDIAKTILMMAGVVGAMWGLVTVLKPLAGMSWGELLKTILGFALMSVVLSKLTKSLMELGGEDGPSLKQVLLTILMMAGVCAAMYVMSKALARIKNVKFGTIMGFALGLSALMLAMSVSAALLSKSSPSGMLIAVVAVVAGIAGIMAVLGSLGPWLFESIGKSLPELGKGIQALGEGIKSFNESISGIEQANIDAAVDLIKGVAKVQLALTGENIALSVFSKLTGQNIEKGNLEAFGKDLAVVGGFVGEFCDEIKDRDFTNVGKAVDAITSIAAVQDKLTWQNITLAVFNKLLGLKDDEKIDPGNLEAFGEDLVGLAGELAKIGDQLSGVNFDSFKTAADALLAIMEVRKSLTGQNITLAVFNKLLGLKDDEKIDPGNLEAFGEDLVGLSQHLEKIGQDLSATDFSSFKVAAEALTAMAEVRKALTGQNITVGIFNWFAGITGSGERVNVASLSAFGNDLAEVAPKLAEIGQKLEGTNFDNFLTAAEALKAMASVQSALNGQQVTMGFFRLLLGDNIKETEIKDFAENILLAAPKIAQISDKLQGKNFDNFSKAATALKAMADVQKTLNNQEIKMGFFKKLFGENVTETDIDTFVSNILLAAPKLSELSDELKDKDFSSAVKAGEAISVFAEIQKTLQDGAVSEAIAKSILKPFGEDVTGTDIASFGEQLIPLGQSIAKFAQSVSYVEMQEGKVESVNTEGFQAAVEAIKVLGGLQEQLPTLGGLVSLFAGDQQTVIDFAKGLGKLGEGLHDMYVNLYKMDDDGLEVTIEKLSTAKDFIYELRNLMYSMFAHTGESSAFVQTKDDIVALIRDLSTIRTPENAEDIDKIVEVMNSVSEATKALNTSFSPYGILDIYKKIFNDDEYIGIQTELIGYGERITQMFADGIDDADSMSIITTAVKNLLSYVTQTTAESLFGNEFSLKDWLESSLGAGIENTDIQNIFQLLDDKVKDEGDDNKLSFKDVGYYLAAGLAIGVSSGTNLIETACRIAVRRARDAAMREANERSPSKVFMQIGAYMSEGMAIGINSTSSSVASASSLIAQVAINTVREEMQIHSPSVVFRRLGEFSGEGLANGMENSESEVTKAGKGLAEAAADGLKEGPVASDSFLEWYIQNETDSGIAAIRDGEKRLDAALDEFNQLPGFKQEAMIKKYQQHQNALAGSMKNDPLVDRYIEQADKAAAWKNKNFFQKAGVVLGIWKEKREEAVQDDSTLAMAKSLGSAFFGGSSQLKVMGYLAAAGVLSAIQKQHDKYAIENWVKPLIPKIAKSFITIRNGLVNSAFGTTNAVKSNVLAGGTETKVEKAGENDLGAALEAYAKGWVKGNTGIDLDNTGIGESTIFSALLGNGGEKVTANALIGTVAKNYGIKLGGDLVTGISDGIIEYTPFGVLGSLANDLFFGSAKAEDEASQAGGNILTAFASAMEEKGVDLPIITPIVDLANVNTAADYISQLLGTDRKINLSADGNLYARESMPTSGQSTGEFKFPDIGAIKQSIESLGGQIVTMGNQISKMQIVLDSGALVGAVTPGVNKNLGAFTTYRRRRN